jgi:hypothetical protein
MERLIRDAYGYSLSDKDIIRMIGKNEVKIIIYKDISKYSSLDKLFGKFDNLVILYTTKANYGHWVTLMRHEQKNGRGEMQFLLEHFDSYGIKIDDELNYVPSDYKALEGEQKPILSYLVAKALIEGKGNTRRKNRYLGIIYNDVPLQKMNKAISTCGRWVTMRIKMKDLPLNIFTGLFNNQKYESDFYATSMTYYL